MLSVKRVLPAFILLTAFCAAPPTQAQESIPLYTTKHCVQVEWYFWRSGGTYWATEYESDNLGDAELVFALFESALENGTLCEILGCNNTTWIPVDVRLKTKYEWNLFPVATSTVNATRIYATRD